MKNMRWLFLLLITFTFLSGCTIAEYKESNIEQVTTDSTEVPLSTNPHSVAPDSTIQIDGVYSTPESVAEYIHTFNQLPANFISKKEATALGWESSKGNLWGVADQQSIGGDSFGNREGKLPREKGRKWYECDVNYKGGYRGSERIVYSSDGLIYYSKDHYKTFTQLY